jgi:hypothetical protein
MTSAASNAPAAPRRPAGLALRDGFRTSWLTLLLIAATNTGFALVLWVDDARPFWHPFVTCQLYGFAIAYCVNVARPWDRVRPLPVLAAAVAAGALIGVVLVIAVKGYAWDYVVARRTVFAWNVGTAFMNGLFVSLFFLVKQREARAEAALHKANAARHLALREAAEAELKMMQAQVEPHFLFNTLASGTDSSGLGVGLHNLRQRLAALFGAEGRFRLEQGRSGGATATLEVPLIVA